MLIQLKDIHKAYGSTVLFDSATALFAPGDKIGMIGRNGSGKTTLCRILLDEEEIDAGQVVRSPQLRLSYLQQKESLAAKSAPGVLATLGIGGVS